MFAKVMNCGCSSFLIGNV